MLVMVIYEEKLKTCIDMFFAIRYLPVHPTLISAR
jgi:hypothetical protein